jgi:hypothetical protein
VNLLVHEYLNFFAPSETLCAFARNTIVADKISRKGAQAYFRRKEKNYFLDACQAANT